jgi:hypothetical protein
MSGIDYGPKGPDCCCSPPSRVLFLPLHYIQSSPPNHFEKFRNTPRDRTVRDRERHPHPPDFMNSRLKETIDTPFILCKIKRQRNASEECCFVTAFITCNFSYKHLFGLSILHRKMTCHCDESTGACQFRGSKFSTRGDIYQWNRSKQKTRRSYGH